MKYAWALAVVVACSTLITGKVTAGARTYAQVSINTTTQTASGAVGTARRVFGVQRISCEVVGSTWDVHCEAVAPDGTFADCDLPSFTDDRAARTVGAIRPDSHISFKWGSAGGLPNACLYIRVTNSSQYEPKPF